MIRIGSNAMQGNRRYTLMRDHTNIDVYYNDDHINNDVCHHHTPPYPDTTVSQLIATPIANDNRSEPLQHGDITRQSGISKGLHNIHYPTWSQ